MITSQLADAQHHRTGARHFTANVDGNPFPAVQYVEWILSRRDQPDFLPFPSLRLPTIRRKSRWWR